MSHPERIPSPGSNERKGVFALYAAEVEPSLQTKLRTLFKENPFPKELQEAFEQVARFYPDVEDEVVQQVMAEVAMQDAAGARPTPDEIRRRLEQEFSMEAFARIKKYVDTEIAPQVGRDPGIRAFDVDNFINAAERLLLGKT